MYLCTEKEKHKKFTQSKFDIFSYTSLFLAFTKEIAGKIKKFTQIWKKCSQTWFAGLRIYPGLEIGDVKENIEIRIIIKENNCSSLSCIYKIPKLMFPPNGHKLTIW